MNRTLLIGLLALVTTQCVKLPDELVQPMVPGTLLVQITTNGLAPDPDGYSVTLDGTVTESVASNGTALFQDLDPGDHTLALSGEAGNCSIAGPNPRGVSVTEGETEVVPFAVSCPGAQLSGTVIDATSGLGLVNALVTFGSVGSTTTGSDGGYSIELPDGDHSVMSTLNGFVPVTLYGADVVAPEVRTLQPILMVPGNPNPGAISGRVVDATTAGTIAGVTVTLRSGQGASSGSPVATATADAAGEYLFPAVPTGTYTVGGSTPGYVDGTRTGYVVGQDTVVGQDVVLSPVGGPSQNSWRIILTWGQDPADLDAHLTGPDGGGGRFHVYWFDTGSLAGPPGAVLDVDDTMSIGPETITFNASSQGVYRYSVHDFTNAQNMTSAALAASGARVQVLRGGQLFQTYFVPNRPGTLWTVFEILDGNLTVLDTMSFETNTDAVPQAVGPEALLRRKGVGVGDLRRRVRPDAE